MREFTRTLKAEAEKDIAKIYYHNNSKQRKRTGEQNTQAQSDKYWFYYKKWIDLRSKCDTKAQIECCEDVLARINTILSN